MEIHYLTGKLLSLIMRDFHQVEETKWSGFLHASAVSQNMVMLLLLLENLEVEKVLLVQYYLSK